ncbi:Alanine racemase [Erwinia piriflorinigrans CFBP 5888]|uniref:Alanine racemase n=1 Tax=Erwinia piriflorinigrans CFBP 5888 TaxID=1161919 RepID=V5Z8U9_9GAMM|nr:Alanine racemase [Erwinia piriflorinigrans CFBP 5888]
MSRPIVATINRAALRQNLAIARQAAGGSRLWSVVKANAYGHGLDRVWQSLAETDGFALLNLEEAILLRERGWKKPILLLEGFFHPTDLEILDRYRLTTSVHSNWQINALSQAKLSAPLDIYLKMNSGMNRLGFQPDQVNNVWKKLRSLENVGELTLMAHFAGAESAEGVAEPLKRIERAAEGLECPRSLANSAATLWHPQTHYDWVRPGIILYGASPSGKWQDIAGTGLQPVMTLTSEIIGVQQLVAGSGVGYGSRYRARRQSAHWRGGVRLCRWLSASCSHRNAYQG